MIQHINSQKKTKLNRMLLPKLNKQRKISQSRTESTNNSTINNSKKTNITIQKEGKQKKSTIRSSKRNPKLLSSSKKIIKTKRTLKRKINQRKKYQS